MTDILREIHSTTSNMVAQEFVYNTNGRIAVEVLLQKTLEGKFCVANRLWGRVDPRDQGVARECRQGVAMYDQGIDITDLGRSKGI